MGHLPILWMWRIALIVLPREVAPRATEGERRAMPFAMHPTHHLNLRGVSGVHGAVACHHSVRLTTHAVLRPLLPPLPTHTSSPRAITRSSAPTKRDHACFIRAGTPSSTTLRLTIAALRLIIVATPLPLLAFGVVFIVQTLLAVVLHFPVLSPFTPSRLPFLIFPLLTCGR